MQKIGVTKGRLIMKAIKIITALCVLIAITATLLIGCSRGGRECAVLYYSYSDTYISSVRGVLDDELDDMDINYHNYDAGTNQTTQTEQVDTALAKGATLLAVNIVNTGSDDAARTILNKAKNAGVPLIFFNRSVSDAVIKEYDKCVFVGTDYEQAGHIQGQMIGNYLTEHYDEVDLNGDGVISYVLFKGQQGNMEAEARTKYAVEDCNLVLASEGYPALRFYDSSNSSKYLVDQDGAWSNAAANNYMKTILSGYSEAGGNMVELVIANNDEMALGALAALEEAGYNKGGTHRIPVFGIDASEAARNKIKSGAMAGTVKQDSEKMAEVLAKIIQNSESERELLDGIDESLIVSDRRINIPYSEFTKDED